MTRLHRTSFGLFTLLGVGLATRPAWGSAETTAPATVGWVLLGVAVLTVALLIWARFLAPPRPADSISSRGDALEIRLRTGTPRATAVLGTVWTALAGWAVVAGGLTGGGLLAVPFALLFAAVVPDSVRASTRRPRLLVDADGVRLRGWSLDGQLAWADTIAVDVVSVRPHRPVIRLTSSPGAASLRRTWHRCLVHVDLETDDPVLDLPLLALDDPARVAAFLGILRGLPREERLLQLRGPGPEFLRGEISLQR